MNSIKTLIITALLSMACLPGLRAQNIDTNRMDRDIHIMNNVLGELFKMQWMSKPHVVMPWSHKDEVEGTYLPNYGVIFTVPANLPSVYEISNNDDASSSFFHYMNQGSKKITKETVISRIQDFLCNYGSTIGQLKNNDRITVIYKVDNPGDASAVYAFSGKGSVKKAQEHTLPLTITVTAKEMDLQAFRKGSISKDQFDKQLNISTIDDEGSHHQDVKVMANILKTTFEDADDDALRISGSVNHMYIDGLGALFYVDTSFGGGFYTLAKGMRVIGKRLSNIFKTDSSGHSTVNFSSSSGNSDNSDKTEEQLKQEHEKAYHQFLDQLKETIVDYGRTLRSVKSDEQVYVSVLLSSWGDVADHVDLQIKKSTLEALDKGRINRSQVMQQITVREY